MFAIQVHTKNGSLSCDYAMAVGADTKETVSKPGILLGNNAGLVGAVLEPPEMRAQPAAPLRQESPWRPFWDSPRVPASTEVYGLVSEFASPNLLFSWRGRSEAL